MMKRISLYTMSALYGLAGANHFFHKEMYMRIMPPWLPLHEALVAISGICEITFALLLLFPATRRVAAWCIVILLVAVFPANIQMMINYIHASDPWVWITVARLPLQFALIWWAYGFTRKKTVR